MLNQTIFAGFGGQGVLSAGKILAHAAMHEGNNVSWLPSYGPEMRGGTANCHVVISNKSVCSPVISTADSVIVMNQPSLEKFEHMVKPNGTMIIDSSLVNKQSRRSDIKVFKVPASKIASEMNNVSFANIVLLGKWLKLNGMISVDGIANALKKVLPEKKHHLIPSEIKALKRGMES